MSSIGLTQNIDALILATERWFRETYKLKSFQRSAAVDKDLKWRPTLSFTMGKHLTVLVEGSEDSAYPVMLSRRRSEILNMERPIVVYCVCPEEVLDTKQGREDMKTLKADGFGLLTVDGDGTLTIHFKPIPLVQIIGEGEFKTAARSLSGAIFRVVRQSFDDYQASPSSGVMKIGELLEGDILSAADDALKQSILTAGERSQTPASLIKTFMGKPSCSKIHSDLSRTRAFVGSYRNTAAHPATTKKDEYIKYRDCRHAFLEGVHTIRSFREAMRSCGVKVRSPVTG